MNLEKKLQKSRLGEAYAGIHKNASRAEGTAAVPV